MSSMSKTVKRISLKMSAITLAIVMVLSVFLQGCGKSEKIAASAKVENGLSAYELAVQYGYEGSVQEWLESLNGKSAYQIAVENGYTGSEQQWTNTLTATMKQEAVSIKTAAFLYYSQ